MSQWVQVVAVVVGGSGVACSGSDEGGSGGITSSVDESKPANQITPAEEKELCEATEGYLKRTVPSNEICKLAGLEAYARGFGTSQNGPAAEEACVKATADCIRENAPLLDIGCEEAEPISTDCDASVGEMTSCLEAAVDKQAEVLTMAKLPDCDGVLEFVSNDGPSDLEDAFDYSISDLPACKNLNETCTEVFSETEEEEVPAPVPAQ